MSEHIKAIIWDLDGTLYQFNADHHRACNVGAAKAAIEMGVNIDFEEAVALAQQGFEKYHNGFQMFHERFGVDAREFQKIHLRNIELYALQPCQMLPSLLRDVSGVKHAVLTHGNRDWARRILAKVGIEDVFGEHIYGLENVDYNKKNNGPEAFEIVMKHLGVTSAETIMVEDAAANLVYPKQLGMKTVFIAGGNPVNENDADYVFNWSADFLEAFKNGQI